MRIPVCAVWDAVDQHAVEVEPLCFRRYRGGIAVKPCVGRGNGDLCDGLCDGLAGSPGHGERGGGIVVKGNDNSVRPGRGLLPGCNVVQAMSEQTGLAQLSDPAAGAAINWATLLALGLGDIVAIDFMARIFAAKSPETAQKACLIGSAGTIIIGVPFSLIALSAPQILADAGITQEGPILYALLNGVVPPLLGLLVIIAILSASLSTADGAILGTSSVIAHNVIGIRHDDHNAAGDRLLLLTRVMAFVITAMGVFFALKVPQTGVLLLLAFDLGFAGLLIPLAGGLYWSKATWQGALSCIVLGSVTRLILFVLMPTTFGIDNTLLYIPNSIFTTDFDGFPTLISPLIGLAAFIIISKLTGSNKPTGSSVHTEDKVPQISRY